MEQIQYSLIVSNTFNHRGLLRSSDPQRLRDAGAKFARDTTHDGDLMLVGPYGNALEQFDIWTDQWTCAV